MDEKQLERAIAGVYCGPLDEFVRRRDTLSKELRSGGSAQPAAAVKSLRKPSRIAWALDVAVFENPAAVETLATAASRTLAAQVEGGDVRSAMTALRAAVRELAACAADAAARGGHSMEPGVLANAVLAVLGRPESFSQLRKSSLTEIPDAGGLDFLTAVPTPSTQLSSPAAQTTRERNATVASQQTAEVEAAAREAAREANVALADARRRAERAQRALTAAGSKLAGAEARLRDATEEAGFAREQHERARDAAERAAAELGDAERASAEAERRLGNVIRNR